MDSSSEDEDKITLAKVAKAKSEPTYAASGTQVIRSPIVQLNNGKGELMQLSYTVDRIRVVSVSVLSMNNGERFCTQ